MPAIVLVLVGLVLFYLAYRFYSKFLAEKIYKLDPDFKTPAHELEDGVEYIPTHKHILMGHHFVSVAGAAPIVGPAIAMIWGWLPAFLWVVTGSIFASGAHDLGSIWVSSRHKGRSIGHLTADLIGQRARLLFLIVIYFLVLMVNAVFALVIAALFIRYPMSVIPIFVEIPLALGIGWLIYKHKGTGVLLPSVTAVAIMYLFVILSGTYGWEVKVPALGTPVVTWVLILLGYGLFSTLLPVWGPPPAEGLPERTPALFRLNCGFSGGDHRYFHFGGLDLGGPCDPSESTGSAYDDSLHLHNDCLWCHLWFPFHRLLWDNLETVG